MSGKKLVNILFGTAAAVAVAASVLVGGGFLKRGGNGSFKGMALRCAIQTGHPMHHLPGLTVGYNYELLRRFAAETADSLSFIANARRGSSWLDSLRAGKVDIVVLPYEETLQSDSVLFSRPVDSLTVWAVRKDFGKGLEEVNAWIGAFLSSDGHEAMRDLYLLRYNPSKRAEWGRTVNAISPYDSLLQAGAGKLGWDWHLLCAIVYQESQFHIEYRSSMGAEGLMQLMPATAANMGVDDLFNPEENIKAGVEYLRHLQDMFRSRAASREELLKFTLAAFNAGEGRILDCINYASSVGADAGTWEGLLSVIPQMRDEATIQVDSVLKLGAFQGSDETVGFVEKVLSLYGDFKRIMP